MFDILKAKESFMNYVRQFDLTNDKIHLKLVHTLEVVRTTEYLCLYENITGVERDLAYLIALLHDIGRFEQIKRFNSFDDRNIDHAKLGVQVLFKEGMIRNFIDDDQYDEIIEKAIPWPTTARNSSTAPTPARVSSRAIPSMKICSMRLKRLN